MRKPIFRTAQVGVSELVPVSHIGCDRRRVHAEFLHAALARAAPGCGMARESTPAPRARRINEMGGVTDSNISRRRFFFFFQKIEFSRAQPRSFCMRRAWRVPRVISSLGGVFLEAARAVTATGGG